MDTTTATALPAPILTAALGRLDAGLAGTHGPPEIAALAESASALDRYRHDPSVFDAVDAYLVSCETFDDRADAYAAVATFSHLGVLSCGSLSWPGWAHPDGRAKRHLRPLEMALIRAMSLVRPAAAAAVALLEAGAASGELAQPTAADVQRDRDGWAVTLPGTARTAPRQLLLAHWADTTIDTLVTQRPTGPLLYTGGSSDPAARQSAVLMAVKKVLAAAGLGGDRAVSPESIRNTAARAAYEAAPADQALQVAADRLGIASLDLVAGRITSDVPPPPPAIAWAPAL